MTDSETEAQTLERIEAALRKIATLAQGQKVASGETGHPAVDRAALINTLDMLISRLRTGLEPAKASAQPE